MNEEGMVMVGLDVTEGMYAEMEEIAGYLGLSVYDYIQGYIRPAVKERIEIDKIIESAKALTCGMEVPWETPENLKRYYTTATV